MHRILLIVLLFPAVVFGASFDCQQVRTTAEQLICQNDNLSSLDDTLAETFTTAIQSTTAPNKLQAEQKTWLAARNRCTNAGCLQQQYEQRIAELSCNPDGVMAGSAIGANQCAYFSRLALDRQLSTLEVQYQQKINRDAESPDNMNSIFKTEQNAWRQYRSAQCALHGAIEGGSDAWKNAFAGMCELDETQKRITSLKAAISGQ
ncbi:lysozyme inhibitor LprI family protein [Paralysiella testudinis]|uniref:DUF1311 domain-containing protein n=1 Tax=Paralysiella testudinis TaxID=2809020 RepID=A0A892ZJX6_9NEIS|nr:lysozyme inhibitor LprI family protein [Paralysiella testudinis]QRQ81199.1 DUF1311 domain-containing protein [Paralysiella testudinis]